MRKILFLILIISLVFACRSLKNGLVTESKQSVAVDQFLEKPFGESETIASLKKQFSKDVKLKRMIRRNKHDSQKVDTIFQFYYRKSEVFVYKTYFNREMLLGGVITDNKFPLLNGVVPGMSRDNFFKSFKDLNTNQADSINLYSKELMRKFIFIFDKKGVLKKIDFSSYVD
ncbi:MAG: hypothetical protein HOO91_18000 [Bacteroidales bacterium]|nr:hypothetical protein [Bacteroidales bacterium]